LDQIISQFANDKIFKRKGIKVKNKETIGGF